jgi:hypothetical protein
MRAVFLLRAFSALALLATLSCNGPNKSSADAQSTVPVMPRTDIEGLERLINLPFRPLDVKWETSTQAGRSDWSLRVLLHFRSEHLQQILKGAGDLGSKRGHMSLEQLSWMPDSVRAETDASGVDKELIPVDALTIGIEQFAAPGRSPLIHGRALVFDRHNLVYLGLYTM